MFYVIAISMLFVGYYFTLGWEKSWVKYLRSKSTMLQTWAMACLTASFVFGIGGFIHLGFLIGITLAGANIALVTDPEMLFMVGFTMRWFAAALRID